MFSQQNYLTADRHMNKRVAHGVAQKCHRQLASNQPSVSTQIVLVEVVVVVFLG
jgi:hypothetical protein